MSAADQFKASVLAAWRDETDWEQFGRAVGAIVCAESAPEPHVSASTDG